MEYKTISQEEKDDMIVSFMHQQEIDHLCHSINKERYERLIEDVNIPEGEFKDRLRKLKDEVLCRMFEVERIMEHTKQQLPPSDRIESAIKRMNDAKNIKKG